MIPTCEPSMPKLPPHVVMVRNKAGRPYYYLQRGRGTARAEKRQRLPDFSDPEFWSEYARLKGIRTPAASRTSVEALVKAWKASPEWASLAGKTREGYLLACQRITAAWGPLDVRGIEPRHVIALRDRFSATPAAANALLRSMSAMLGWSVPRGWRADNPCREVPLFRTGGGYQPWPWPVIETARIELEARRPDLWWAMALALYTGQRQSDVLAMRWDAIHGGMIAVKQEKTDKRLAIPLHRELQRVLSVIPKRAVTIVTSTKGVPWGSGFKGSWQAWGPEVPAGLVFHGLRKSAVNCLLEAGCTESETAAVTGQSLAMVQHYSRGVNQAKLARGAIAKWEAGG